MNGMLQRLLGETPVARFVEDCYSKFPYSCPGGAREFTDYVSWQTAAVALEQPQPDIILCRQGHRWDEDPRPSLDTVRSLHADGYTLMIRNAERLDAKLAQVADDFHRAFLAPIDIQLYFTPGAEFGFGWHYDAEDVFILQLSGTKEYSLRKNTVNPWPLKETLPPNMHYEREVMPMMKCKLDQGDWLYIPAGYWHRAESLTESISMAVGVMTTSAMDVLDYLRPRLLRSFVWRQRLPVLGDAASVDEQQLLSQCREIFQHLGDDLQALFKDEQFLRDFLKSKGRPIASS